jgi:predicted anti-sigma-YlaC factor YlaD
MSGCEPYRDLLTPLLEGELEADEAARVRAHLEACEECRELAEALEMVAGAVAPLDELQPPAGLADDLASSPCRRWLGLLFRAVDRELGEANLNRLLGHLDSCETCRRAWNDLSLIHQVGDAMVPPPHLLARCIAVRSRPRRRRVLGRHTASAAAYILAALVSLAVANPVTMTRGREAADTVQRLAATVSEEVSDVASDGRGELRVMLWRAWQWTSRQADAVRHVLVSDDDSDRQQQGG